jgi:uncharacterized membrane protein
MANPKRPVLNIPATPTEKVLGILAAVGVMLTWIIVASAWPNLPQLVPTHFGLNGKADATGPAWTVWILPVVQLLLATLLTVVKRYPQSFNYLWAITPKNAGRQYLLARMLIGWLCLEMVSLFAYLSWQTIQTALGSSVGLGLWFLPIILLVLTLTIGFYLWLAYQMR